MIATWDGHELDLAPDQFPAFTFRADDIDDVGGIAGSKGTTLDLPATNRNRSILGGPHMAEQTVDSGEFKVVDGGAVLYSGTGFVIERSDAGYTVSIVGDNASWFTALGDTRLSDVDMGVSEEISQAMMSDTWESDSSSLYFPVIDYGNLENRPNSDDISVTYLRPGIRIKPFAEQAFIEAGYSLVADGSFASLWPKLVIPNNSDKVPISDGYLEQSSARFDKSTQQQIVVIIPAYTEVTYPIVTNDPGGTYTGTGRYTAPYDQTVNVKARIKLSSTLYGGNGIIHVRVQFYDFTSGQGVFADKQYVLSILAPVIEDEFYFGTLDMQAGFEYGIRVKGTRSLSTTAVMFVDSGFVDYEVTDVPYQAGVTLDIAKQAPDLKVTDVIKWVANLFCLDINTRGSVVTLKRYDEFYRPPSDGFNDVSKRINWPPVKVTEAKPSAYLFRHRRDDKDRLIEDLRERDGEFAAGNYRQRLGGYDDEKAIEIGFAATEMAFVLEAMRVPALRDIDGEANIAGIYPDRYKWVPRILIADGTVPADWRWGGVLQSEAPNCYSYPESINASDSALFGNMVDDPALDRAGIPGAVERYWQTKVRRFTGPKLEVPVLWYDHEVMMFDRSKAVKCSDGYNDAFYYVQTIDRHSFGSDRSTVTLLLQA